MHFDAHGESGLTSSAEHNLDIKMKNATAADLVVVERNIVTRCSQQDE